MAEETTKINIKGIKPIICQSIKEIRRNLIGGQIYICVFSDALNKIWAYRLICHGQPILDKYGWRINGKWDFIKGSFTKTDRYNYLYIDTLGLLTTNQHNFKRYAVFPYNARAWQITQKIIANQDRATFDTIIEKKSEKITQKQKKVARKSNTGQKLVKTIYPETANYRLNRIKTIPYFRAPTIKYIKEKISRQPPCHQSMPIIFRRKIKVDIMGKQAYLIACFKKLVYSDGTLSNKTFVITFDVRGLCLRISRKFNAEKDTIMQQTCINICRKLTDKITANLGLYNCCCWTNWPEMETLVHTIAPIIEPIASVHDLYPIHGPRDGEGTFFLNQLYSNISTRYDGKIFHHDFRFLGINEDGVIRTDVGYTRADLLGITFGKTGSVTVPYTPKTHDLLHRIAEEQDFEAFNALQNRKREK